ncbi:hypothetical protein [Nonomuraea sp. SYSU D8015]|uniref:hypothetical protein n=1 Tax=Nonomuraea sp. SYSU D8015 TaxID=2593644 RepID=UPI001CB6F34A|nr:hypothetical protein [Nonomuraea sp. SYSU D8015]
MSESRLLTLLSLLQTPREWPGGELAERLLRWIRSRARTSPVEAIGKDKGMRPLDRPGLMSGAPPRLRRPC